MPLLPLQQTADGALLLGEERVVLHCHRYNHSLHQALHDLDPAWAQETFESAGRTLGFRLAVQLVEESSWAGLAPEEMAQELPAALGFGRLSGVAPLPEGEEELEFFLEDSHLTAEPLMDGGQAKCSCGMVGGLVAGVLAARSGQPAHTVVSQEVECRAQGAERCRFLLRTGVTSSVPDLPRADLRMEMAKPPGQTYPHPAVDKLQAGFADLPIQANPHGMIPAFGVYLAYQSASYYAYLAATYMHRATRGGKVPSLASRGHRMLQEAGHTCAFHTLGGLLQSVEWQALAAPHMLDTTDPGETMRALFAIFPLLGWGVWTPLHPNSLEVHLHHGPEPHQCREAGLPLPNSDFACGLHSGVLNIVAKAGLHLAEREELNRGCYAETFFRGSYWSSEEVHSSVAEGCRFRAKFLNPLARTS